MSLRLDGKYLKGKRYQLEYPNYIDHPAAKFIKHHQSNELCKRDQQDLNWILQTPQKDEMGKKYAFTALAPTIVDNVKLLRFNRVTIFNEVLVRKFSEQKNGVLFKKNFDRIYLATKLVC